MTDREHDASPPAGRSSDAVERLLRLAGPRDIVDSERRDRVRQRVRVAWRESVRARVRRRWLTISGVGLAAAAALITAISLRTGTVIPPPSPVVARLTTATGPVSQLSGSTRTQLNRGDGASAGTNIELNGEAVATFALEGGGELRLLGGTLVRLLDIRRLAIDRGVVYVDTGTSLRDRSIAIETHAGVVRDIGTRFEVRVDSGVLRVRVRDGAVRLERDGANYDASAGRELTADAKGVVRVGPTATYGSDWDWIARAAPFDVEGTRLARFLQWAEKEGGREIAFSDPRLEKKVGNTVLHGSIAGLTIDEALGVVLPTCGLTYRTAGARVIVEAGQPR